MLGLMRDGIIEGRRSHPHRIPVVPVTECLWLWLNGWPVVVNIPSRLEHYQEVVVVHLTVWRRHPFLSLQRCRTPTPRSGETRQAAGRREPGRSCPFLPRPSSGSLWLPGMLRSAGSWLKLHFPQTVTPLVKLLAKGKGLFPEWLSFLPLLRRSEGGVRVVLKLSFFPP